MLTAEQQAIRARGIGGSEIAAVAGLSPWAGPIDVWRHKVGQNSDDEETFDPFHLERGTFLEPGIIRWYAHLTQRKVVSPGTLVHPKHPVVRATPDGISRPIGGPGPDLILEVKCPTWRTMCHWGEAGSNQVPEYYWPQVMWECAVTGLQSAHVCCYAGERPAIYNVDFDSEIFEGLVEIAEQFWTDHVLTGRPPPIDGSESAADWLAHRYPRASLEVAQADDAVLPWIAQLRAAREERARAEKREREAANQIKDWLGDRGAVDFDGGRIRWSNKTHRSLDTKGLIAHLGVDPEIVQQFMREKPIREFRPQFTEAA